MNALSLYRDDGPLARLAARRLASAEPGPYSWLLPPLVRSAEYGLVIALTALTDADVLPAAFAYLGVLAFHHYDIAYRLRDRGEPPPAWVGAIGGGWEGRSLVVALLAAVGFLGPGLVVLAVVLGTVWIAESAAGWIRWIREASR